MRLEALALLMPVLLVASLVSAEPRESGRGDSSRHPEAEMERSTPRFDHRPDRGINRAESLDPAVRQFWSERCVRQRRFGLPHTGDCDHPAYSGSGYGGGYGYRRYPGYKPYGPRTIYEHPRGGAIIIERDRLRRFEQRPPAPSHLRGGEYRDHIR
jgi:hypothetical protein